MLAFIDCESVTGHSVCEKIIDDTIRGVNLQPELCRAQTYDGAGNMAGRINVCAAHFLKLIPQATYYHCASHQLNLAISKKNSEGQ